jgi:hypothetical protein
MMDGSASFCNEELLSPERFSEYAYLVSRDARQLDGQHFGTVEAVLGAQELWPDSISERWAEDAPVRLRRGPIAQLARAHP